MIFRLLLSFNKMFVKQNNIEHTFSICLLVIKKFLVILTFRKSFAKCTIRNLRCSSCSIQHAKWNPIFDINYWTAISAMNGLLFIVALDSFWIRSISIKCYRCTIWKFVFRVHSNFYIWIKKLSELNDGETSKRSHSLIIFCQFIIP